MSKTPETLLALAKHARRLTKHIPALLFLFASSLLVGGCMTQTPLTGAALRGDTMECRRLLDNGANIEECGYLSCTPLMNAAQRGHLDTMKLLLDKGANVNAASKHHVLQGHTALMWAAQVGTTDAVRLLLDKGARVNAKTGYGATALMFAAQWGRTAEVELLASRGADMNARTKDNETALYFAAKGFYGRVNFSSRVETVKTLLAHGARDERLIFEDNQNRVVLGVRGGYYEAHSKR